MKLTFLGTGGVTAAPLLGCDCAACLRARGDRKRQRAPCSALIEAGGERFLLDAALGRGRGDPCLGAAGRAGLRRSL